MSLRYLYLAIAIVAALLVGVLAALLGASGAALAQETTQQTVIRWDEILAPWVSILVPAVGGLLLALLGWAAAELKARTGIAIQQAHLVTLQTTLQNAAGKVLMRLGDKIRDAKLDVRHPAIREAVLYVNGAAADTVKAYELTEDQIAEKILAKIGVLTASDATASPRDVTPPPPDPGAGG
jgi:hypothetical protein